ncbi:MAG: hypothetical protein AB9873_05900 [Syntrophobacteraceae bacterium]
MHIVLYSPTENDNERSLLEQILRVVESRDVVLCRTIEELNRGLLVPSYDLLAAVVHPRSKQDLDRLRELRDLLSPVRLILVLPDARQETLDAGYRLMPRFVSSSSEDITMIAPVLERMNETARKFALRIGGVHSELSQ